MKQKHTPGPWGYAYDDRGECVIDVGPWCPNVYGRIDPVVASVPQDGNDNEEANARLIAAAPDLLEAAKKAKAALLMFGHIEPMPSWLEEAFKATVAAIRKAEGK